MSHGLSRASPEFVHALGSFEALQQVMTAHIPQSNDAEKISDLIGEDIDNLARSLCDLPAVTLTDCAVKARVLSTYIEPDADLASDLGLALCTDILRLATGRVVGPGSTDEPHCPSSLLITDGDNGLPLPATCPASASFCATSR